VVPGSLPAKAEKLVGDDWDEFYEEMKKRDIQDPRLKKN